VHQYVVAERGIELARRIRDGANVAYSELRTRGAELRRSSACRFDEGGRRVDSDEAPIRAHRRQHIRQRASIAAPNFDQGRIIGDCELTQYPSPRLAKCWESGHCVENRTDNPDGIYGRGVQCAEAI
jgi:hypothetical protein